MCGSFEEIFLSLGTLLEECHVGTITDIKCYALTVDRLAQQLEERKGKTAYFQNTGNKPEYTKKDEAYFLEFQQEYDGISFCKYPLASKLEQQDFGYGVVSDGTAMYSAEGLIFLGVSNLFDIKNKGEEKKLIELSEIMKKAVSQLQTETANGAEVEVKEIGLHYLPVLKEKETLEFEAKPVWVIAYLNTNCVYGSKTDQVTFEEYKVYDAFTGEEMH